ncbi:MAG: class I SAM-dependent methyltransferase [Pseudomonadota bacterium]
MAEGAPADIGSAEADLDPSTARYAARFSGPAGTWLLSRQTAAVEKLIAPHGAGAVLDVGGGHGQVAGPLTASGRDVTVLASSEAALGQAATITSPRLSTVIGDLSDPPFPDRSFDVVVSMRIMAHIGDWRCFLAGLTRVARKAVIVDFPIPGGANALEPLLFGVKKRLEGDTRRFATMTKRDVRDALSENGFDGAGHIGQFVLPMVVHRKLQRPALSGAIEGALGGVGLASAIGTPVVMCGRRRNVD